jgi:hypothetical protein
MKTRFGAKDSLITNESGFVHQADLGKSHFDSISLKGIKMANAKTLRKRIALVAAAALGVGMLAAAPAFAVTITGRTVTAVSNITGRVGIASVVPIFVTTTGVAGAGETQILTPTTTGAAATVNAADNTASNIPTGATGWAVTATAGGSLTATAGGTSGAAIVASTNELGTISITPTAPGTVTVTLTSTGTVGLNPAVATFTITVPPLVYTLGNTAAASPYNTGTGLPGPANSVTVTGTTTNVAGVRALVTVSGAGATISTASNVLPATVAAGATSVTITAVNSSAIVITTPTAGTITVNLYNETGAATGIFNSTADGTVTITVAATAGTTYSYTTVGAAVLTGTSVAQQVSGGTLATAVAGTQAESWTLSQFDATGTAMSVASSAAVTASLVGVGATQINAGTSGGYATLAAGAANTGGFDTVKVIADGRAGAATVTISVNGVTVATKTLTFYGAVASLTAVANKSVLGTNAATLLAATVTAKDAAGTLVPFIAAGKFSAVSSSTAVLASSGTFAEDLTVGGTYGGQGNYTATVTTGVLSASGQTATITYTYTSGTLVVNAAALTFTVGGAASTVTFAFDKTSYAPGTAAVITVTAKDSSGNPAASAVVVLANAIVSNVAASGLPNTAALTSKNGTATLSVYAPATSGTWIITDAANTVTGAAVTATTTVAGGTGGGLSAADSAAIAAAKAAADAATAAVATLSTTIASLIASITAQIRALAAQIAKLTGKSGGTTPGLPKTGAKK